jgi:quercetin dioxygenase-like cupin family protein
MTDERSDTDPNAAEAQPYFELAEAEGFDGGASGGSITHMDSIPSYEIAEGLFFRPVFATNMSFNFVTFPPHSGFPSHVHPEEQVSIVREGEMEITIGDHIQWVRPGDVIIFPPNVPHAGRTGDEPCRLIDTFSPPRTGILDVIASADPVRSADVDRWWADNESDDG